MPGFDHTPVGEQLAICLLKVTGEDGCLCGLEGGPKIWSQENVTPSVRK